MIKFFKKIRQDLLSKGKTGKYFKYAVGEIILVVIGILIALQINNWNNDKINSSETNEFNKRLLAELNGNLDLSERKINDIEQIINTSKRILGLFNESSIEVNSQSLDSLIYIVIGGVRVEYIKGTLSEGLNTGKVALLESDILKSKLYGLPSNMEYVSEYDKVYGNYVNDYLQPFLYKNFNYRNMDNANSNYNSGTSKFKFDHHKTLLMSEEFENLIDNSLFNRNTQLNFHMNLKKELEEIKKLIATELQTKK